MYQKHYKCIIISHTKVVQKQLLFFICAPLKVNPKCGFTQYKGPTTYNYNYYVSPKYGENCSLQSFEFLRSQSLYPIKHLPNTYRSMTMEYMRVI